MIPETDPNNFTQKDLMQHLLHAAQHSVTREEMARQFALAERVNQERFEQTEKLNQGRFEMLNKQFEQMDKRFEQTEKLNHERFNSLSLDNKALNAKHDRLLWALFSGMLVIFFKDVILGAFA